MHSRDDEDSSESLESLKRSLQESRDELHKLNLSKMNTSIGTALRGEEDRNVEHRTYSMNEGVEARYKALENCSEIASIVRQRDQAVAKELDQKITTARKQLEQNKTSPVSLDEGLRSELIPLVNKSEQLLETSV